jgi:Ca-activated chloride channel family protein
MGRSVLIPIRDAAGTEIVDYYQDEDGAYLKTRLEQDPLKNIAAITGGQYFRARDDRSEDRIVDAIIKRARAIEYTKVAEPAWFYLSPLLLCAALLFFVTGIIVGR